MVRDVSLQFFAQPEVQKKVRDMGMEPAGKATPDELSAELKVAYQAQAEVLKSINYQPQ